MGDIVSILGRAFEPTPEPRHDPPEVQLADDMERAGIKPPDSIRLDGKLHRFDIAKGDKAGWFIAWSDNVPAGRFGDWKNGIDEKWRADIGRELSPVEQMAMAQRQREAQDARDAALAKSRNVAAETVQTIWERAASSPATPDHPYLARKGIQPHGARATGDGRLMMPLYTPEGVLASLQYIDADGDKRYHPGSQTGGHYWMIGQPDGTGPLYIAEGFATAATVAEETGRPCAVAYQASNLEPVAGALRAKHGPALDLVIVADNDKSGTGQKYANKAAASHGARVVLPPVIDQDINDYRAAGGDVGALLRIAAKAKPASAFAFTRVGEMQSRPPEYLVNELVETSSMGNMFGDPGHGKSFLAVDLALCVATGTPFHGRAVKQGPVFYIAGEGHNGLKRRFDAWAKARGVDISEAPLFVSNRPAQFLDEASALEVAAAVEALADQYGSPTLIEIDTVARNFGNGDENSTKDMNQFIAAIDHLRMQYEGCTALVLHHTGHGDKQRARGSIALKAALDCEYRVEKNDNVITFTCTKMKDGAEPEPIAFELKSVELDEGTSSAVLVETEARLKAKRLSPGQTVALHAFCAAAASKGQLDHEGQFSGLSEADWRAEFYAWHKANNPEAKQDSARKAFNRARDDLLDCKRLRCDGELFFPTDAGDLAAISMRSGE
jgi:putative DNA primase/helicase